jgi:2-polyprenyl-3-methyl-5-hydroxy-6-metoxy-1,4-benzoquinol methylase
VATSTDDLTERIFGSLIATGEVLTIYLGDRLGLYAALAEGAATSEELASRAGIAERYAREWLEQQTTAGFLEVDDVDAPAAERRFSLPPEHANVLLHQDEVTYLPPIARIFVSAAQKLPELMQAYREGGGVGWRAFGTDMSEGQEYGNRPAYLASMDDWIADGMPDVHERLAAGGRVADVGCGGGWSSIAIAKAYPEVTVEGFDLDEPAVERARKSAERDGVSDRVRFHAMDPAELDHGDGYALVTAFECIHDMPQPVPVLRSIRSMAGRDGAVMVMDENVAPSFGAIGDDTERLMYTFSTLICLADGMSHPNSVGTGTVMRPHVLEGYAREAGFQRTEILPIDGGLWRFYRLHP